MLKYLKNRKYFWKGVKSHKFAFNCYIIWNERMTIFEISCWWRPFFKYWKSKQLRL